MSAGGKRPPARGALALPGRPDAPGGGASRAADRRRGTRGFTVVETLVALLLAAGLVQLCLGVAAAYRRGLLRLVERGDVLEAERTVWWVLTSETGAGTAGRDWWPEAPGVLGLRAFRGWGVGCPSGVDPEGWIEVRYRGWRLPEPDKDSVVVLDVRGGRSVARLLDRSTGAPSCRHVEGERPERWLLGPPPLGPVVLVRLFERGSYHLEDEAFRYRRGAGGRQPLTGEVLDPSGSGLSEAAGGGVRVRFRGHAGHRPTHGPGPDPGWTRVLRGG